MRKTLTGIMILMMAFCLCGCGEKSPSDVVKDAFEAMKTQDAETVNLLYGGDDVDFNQMFGENSVDSSLDEENQALLMEKFLDFGYTIDDEQINGDKATVTVTITTYDFDTAFQDYMREALTTAFSYAFSDASDDEINQAINASLSTILNGLTEKDKVQTATLSLTKSDDGWIIDDFTDNTEFIDAITGGAYSTVKNMSDSFSDTEE